MEKQFPFRPVSTFKVLHSKRIEVALTVHSTCIQIAFELHSKCIQNIRNTFNTCAAVFSVRPWSHYLHEPTQRKSRATQARSI